MGDNNNNNADNQISDRETGYNVLWAAATFFVFIIGIVAFNSQSVANFASTLDVNPKSEMFKEYTNKYVAFTNKYGLTGPRELIEKVRHFTKGDN